MAADKFEIPTEMRAFAEKSVDQAKKAFDDFIHATQQAASKAETSATTIQAGALEMNRKVLSLAEENVAAVFEHAQKLVKAKNPEEIARLHSEFLKAQMATFGEQARLIGDAAAATVSGIAEQAKKG